MKTFSIELAGAQFRPAETKDFIRNMQPGDGTLFTFERDAENPYDENAVKLIAISPEDDLEYFLGFVPKWDAVQIAPILDAYIEVDYAIEHTGFVSTLKPFFEITFPDTVEDE